LREIRGNQIGEGDGGGVRIGLEWVGRRGEREGKKWWVVGPDVANHHMSAHGMGWPTCSLVDGTDGWIGRQEREREAERDRAAIALLAPPIQ